MKEKSDRYDIIGCWPTSVRTKSGKCRIWLVIKQSPAMPEVSPDTLSSATALELLDAFRNYYHRFQRSVDEAVTNGSDSVVLW